MKRAKRTPTLRLLCGLLALVISSSAKLAIGHEPQFDTIVLGAAGGLTEGNLSAYLLAPLGSSAFIALDAGVLLTGLQRANSKGNLSNLVDTSESPLSAEGQMLTQHIKAYLLSHAHLDHLAGLVINSPDDTKKNILALSATIEQLQRHVFNGQVWPNFSDEGVGLLLKKYHYVRVQPGEEVAIEGTAFTVTPFALCHAGVTSTAFLLQTHGAYALYIGDTGPDEAEHCEQLHQLWQAVAPLIRQGALHGMFVEISYPDERDIARLYGHLTPKWLMTELHRLAALVDTQHPTDALKGLTVIVSHIKPTLQRGPDARTQIMQQVHDLNDAGVQFVFPEQGDRIAF